MNYGKTFDSTGVKLSYSSLKAFQRSPLHFMQYKFGEKSPPSPSMILGRAVDVLVDDQLKCNEGKEKKFDKQIAIMPEINRRTNDGKAEYAAFCEKNADKTIITPADFEKAQAMAKAIAEHPIAQSWLSHVKRTQKKILWKYKKTGHELISYIDFDGEHPIYGDFIGELKIAADASTDKFTRDAYNFGYPFQCGTYLEAYMRKYFKFPAFVYIVVESSEPYAVNVLKADDKYKQFGRDELKSTLAMFRMCQDQERFDEDYTFVAEGENQLALPGYYKNTFGVIVDED